MTDIRVDTPPGVAEVAAPSVDETAERLLQVLPSMFKRLMGEARMQMPAELQIGETQFRIIHTLTHRDYMVSEMAECMRVRTPTISRMVDTLAERGYVDRQPDAADRRKVWLRLTESGQALARGTDEAFHRAVARFLRPLNGKDLMGIVATCDTFERLLVSERTKENKTHSIREDQS